MRRATHNERAFLFKIDVAADLGAARLLLGRRPLFLLIGRPFRKVLPAGCRCSKIGHWLQNPIAIRQVHHVLTHSNGRFPGVLPHASLIIVIACVEERLLLGLSLVGGRGLWG